MDSETFRLTVVPLYRELFAVAVAIVRDRDDASDIVQEAMVKMWNSRDRLDSVVSIKAFAISCLRNTAIDWLRNRPRLADMDDPVAAVAAAPPPPDNESVEVIEAIINNLPPGQRQVIRLNAIEGCSTDEISSITGYSPANVRQLLSRARKRIKEMYYRLST